MSRGIRLTLLVLAVMLGLVPAHAVGRQTRITDVGVTFTVRNVNDSLPHAQSDQTAAPCAADGRIYTIRGHITGPASALNGKRAATLYLHPNAMTQDVLRFRAVPGYDYAATMAGLGQVSVVIDQLGYGVSDRPEGSVICFGAQASIAHQIVQALRTGGYAIAGRKPVKFPKIALAGMTSSAMVAHAVAYSYADIDALLPMAFADGPVEPGFMARMGKTIFEECGLRNGSSDAPPGYFWGWPTPADEAADELSNADGAVIDAFKARIAPLPCGIGRSIAAAVAADAIYLPTITVPVLVVMGDKDKMFPPPAGDMQKNRYPGSDDVTLLTVHDAGNLLPLERTRGQFATGVARWLAAHGF